MSKNREIEVDVMDIIDALVGASLVASQRGYDRSKDKTAKACANKVKQYEDTQVDAPRLTDFIDKIIAQDTATVIFWKDGTKTAVKCGKNESYDYEKGLAMAILKYIFGNRYYKDMLKLIEKFPYTKNAPVKKKQEKTTTKVTASKTVKKSTKTAAKKSVKKEDSSVVK